MKSSRGNLKPEIQNSIVEYVMIPKIKHKHVQKKKGSTPDNPCDAFFEAKEL
jgi:hypothetical protein